MLLGSIGVSGSVGASGSIDVWDVSAGRVWWRILGVDGARIVGGGRSRSGCSTPTFQSSSPPPASSNPMLLGQ